MVKKSDNQNISSDIEEMVLEIIADYYGLPSPSISISTHIMKDCGANLFDQMELIMTVEELFGIKIPEDDARRIERIGDIVNAIIKIAPSQSDLETARLAWRIASKRRTE